MQKEQTKNGIFENEKVERVRSPEELDAYIRVVRPGTLILVISLVLVLAALIVWGFTGTIPYTKTVDGVVFTELDRYWNFLNFETDTEGYNTFMDQISKLDEEERNKIYEKKVFVFLDAFEYDREELMGREIIIRYPGVDPMSSTITAIESVPYTREEITNEFGGEWVTANCVDSDFSWVVACQLSGNSYEDSGSLVSATVLTEDIRPIVYLFR